MATRSHLIAQLSDGTYAVSYVHFDGYGHSHTLNAHYNTQAKVDSLLALGSLSVLDRLLEGSPTHSFNTPDTDTTIAYYRDRGDPWEECKPRIYKHLKSAIAYTHRSYWIEYYYIWLPKVGAWSCHQNPQGDYTLGSGRKPLPSLPSRAAGCAV